MIEQVIKAVKRGNKKRSKNITIGAVVGFLLSCTAVMGADEYLWIKNDGGGIKFNTIATTNLNGTDGNWNKNDPYSDENTWNTDTKTYINNMTLSSSANNGVNDGYGTRMNYGLRLSGNLSGCNLINNGSITVTGGDPNYGIFTEGAIGNLINNGSITVAGTNMSGGITTEEAIGNLINNGLIAAEGKMSMGIFIKGAIENLINNGLIAAEGEDSNGITMVGSTKILINSGSVTATTAVDSSIYGIAITGQKMKILANNGLITTVGTGSNVVYAIEIEYGEGITNLINNGLIAAKGNDNTSGIKKDGAGVDVFRNIGVIYGRNEAVGGNFSSISNYGILANGIDSSVPNSVAVANYGLYIAGNTGVVTAGGLTLSGEVITTGYDEDGTELKRKMTVKNAEIVGISGTGTSTESIVLESNNYENHILNGKNNTLSVSGTGKEVKGSVINAYETAVKFDTGGGELALSGTIVNGGIKEGTPINTISGSDNADTLTLQSGEIDYTDVGKKVQNTVINGNINMGAGDDTLTVGNGTIMNGTIAGGVGNDTLNFKSAAARASSDEGINILYNISDFENMNINTNVTLFEKTVGSDGKPADLKVTGADSITIGAGGVLTLRIDTTKTSGNKIIGHALYGNTGTISSTGGKLLLALNGAGNDSVISLGATQLDSTLVAGSETFDTTSKLHTVERVEGAGNEVRVTARLNLPSYLKYPQLNKIYHSILSVDELGNFNVDNDENLSAFLGYLNDIYAGNPYSYSSELSRKSMGMFRDIVTENSFKPETNKWMIYGGLTHIDGGTKDTYYGKGYYTYDIGSSDIKADTKITGAYMLGEYGVSDTLTAGVVIGGNKLKSDLSNGSKLDGDALYMGAYAKKYVGNLKVTAGAGFQYGDYDIDRLAVNNAASSTAESVMKYSDNYNDISYDIYLNGRYSHNIGDNLFLEPYGTLSYTYIKQDGADEGNKTLAIETDSKTFDYTTAKVGVDLKKVIPHEKGKSTVSAGVSYTRILSGADEEYITGRFKGGSDFDILVAHKNEHSIGLNAKYALELENGILFEVKGSYAVERDSHNGTGKNKTKGEWIVGAGLGYRF